MMGQILTNTQCNKVCLTNLQMLNPVERKFEVTLKTV